MTYWLPDGGEFHLIRVIILLLLSDLPWHAEGIPFWPRTISQYHLNHFTGFRNRPGKRTGNDISISYCRHN